ncbi:MULTISPECIES: YggS family pyridoxal phosphate-dependent enzyme [unclassified Methanosarcina]|uniref:YggS family pyridoxal phosphate-dependent enzyme n=1 Tax=unclassified Methanosarcina TaxID=2644672 RepID=UPI00061610B4|nr:MULTISPECIES: YggS family pyridoxal phosphate-dependent enzyme [unclassified Methanosarcina]AKB17191.1 pyridoxal phosphate enzyme, YggS family [Methanosarcina sp. WWM596]AKB20596.1 pyridoxal phosphate enzyme, YggS family [Methanosarcina sp. WH1]
MPVDEIIKLILKEIGNTKLVCVTKTIEPERINEVIRAGATIIGENRVQEYEDKCDDILPCETHLIGHLQTNKVKKAVHLFDLIQSVDSLKLIRDINRRAGDINKVQKVFLQVNIGNESQKYGFGPDEVKKAINEIHSLGNVRLEGLMCIPPFLPSEQTRFYFRKMKVLFDEMKQENRDNINIRELSMGMSNDYRISIEEGATMVRVGTAIFGERKY